jgi:hypothetical protein
MVVMTLTRHTPPPIDEEQFGVWKSRQAVEAIRAQYAPDEGQEGAVAVLVLEECFDAVGWLTEGGVDWLK